MKKFSIIIMILLSVHSLSAQWIQQNPCFPEQGYFQDIFSLDQYHVWTVGSEWGSGTTDGGSTWEPLLIEYMNGIHFSDQFNGWATGDNGGIWHTDDGGIGFFATWEQQESGTDYNLENIFFVDSLTGWAVGWKDGYITWAYDIILSTKNGGNTWEIQYQGHSGGLSAIYFINDTTGWVAGWAGLLFTNNRGNDWSLASISGELVQSVFFTDILHGWIAGGYESSGFISFSSDGGITWEQQISDTIPVLHDITFVDSITGWAVGDSGTILYTSNGGLDWQYQESGTNLCLHSVSFGDLDHGWICGDSCIILYTSNGGIVGTDQLVQDPGFQVQVYPNPFSDQVSVEFEVTNPSRVSIELMNSLANIVWTKDLGTLPSGIYTNSLDIRHLASGIYFCRLQVGDQVVVKRLVKL